MHVIVAEQEEMGLDWTARVHMRLELAQDGRADPHT
jgi:hypothetical protein